MKKWTLAAKCYIKELPLTRKIRMKRFKSRIYSDELANKAIDHFLGKDACTGEERAELIKDMKRASEKQSFTCDEYFLFELRNKTDEERYEFISDIERISICEDFNSAKNQFIFDDKGQTYLRFKEYFKRDLICVWDSKKKTLDMFLEFCKKHPRFIVKPVDGTLGRGVRIVDTDEEGAEAAFNELRKTLSYFVCEELIVQESHMSELYPKSVNTIRISTIRTDRDVHIIYPRLRIGQGGNIVDNAGAGGILCTLDPDTGTITAAADKSGKVYDVHPDTGAKLVGFTVPKWDEVTDFVKKLAEVVHGNRYAGWDIALTENGWVLVEGNARGQFGWQIVTKKGFRTELNAYLAEINNKKHK